MNGTAQEQHSNGVCIELSHWLVVIEFRLVRLTEDAKLFLHI